MIDLPIILSMCGALLIFLWLWILRSRPSHEKRAIRLVLFGHVAGAAIVLSMLVIVGVVELLGPNGFAGWTLRRALAAALLWLLMSAFVAGALVHNAKRGRRGIFGILGRGVL